MKGAATGTVSLVSFARTKRECNSPHLQILCQLLSNLGVFTLDVRSYGLDRCYRAGTSVYEEKKYAFLKVPCYLLVELSRRVS